MANDKQTPKELKVTDKRIFTSEGEIRDEFKKEIRPADPQIRAAQEPAHGDAGEAPAAEPPGPPAESRPKTAEAPQQREERRRSLADKATNPGTPFANFVQSLVMQTYMFLGMLRDPRAPEPMFDAAAARETIDILVLLREKTTGNLTPEEDDFFEAHLGEVKLAFVQRTKSI